MGFESGYLFLLPPAIIHGFDQLGLKAAGQIAAGPAALDAGLRLCRFTLRLNGAL